MIGYKQVTEKAAVHKLDQPWGTKKNRKEEFKPKDDSEGPNRTISAIYAKIHP